MSILKKSDVKSHLSRHQSTRIHLHQPESQPDATGFSGEESGNKDSLAGNSMRESSEQPAPSGPGTASMAAESGLKPVLMPAVSKSTRA
jgi:hypothetical protein